MIWSQTGIVQCMHERVVWRVFVKDVGAELHCFLEEDEENKRWSEAEERREWPLIAITAVHTMLY